MTHKLIEYTNLLHKYDDPNAPEVRRFLEQHAQNDPKFLERARKLNLLFVKATKAEKQGV